MLECESFTLSNSGNVAFDFVYRARIIDTNNSYEIPGKLEPFKGRGQSQLQARFTMTFVDETPSQNKSDYNVLYADSSCTIVWDCDTHRTSVNGTESVTNSQVLRIMTRARSPIKSVETHCISMLDTVLTGYDDRSLMKINQEGCDIESE